VGKHESETDPQLAMYINHLNYSLPTINNQMIDTNFIREECLKVIDEKVSEKMLLFNKDIVPYWPNIHVISAIFTNNDLETFYKDVIPFLKKSITYHMSFDYNFVDLDIRSINYDMCFIIYIRAYTRGKYYKDHMENMKDSFRFILLRRIL
jgi:hypothetical protein